MGRWQENQTSSSTPSSSATVGGRWKKQHDEEEKKKKAATEAIKGKGLRDYIQYESESPEFIEAVKNTKPSEPKSFLQMMEETGDTIGRTTFALAEIPFNKEARQEFGEGFTEGTLGTAASVERSGGKILNKLSDGVGLGTDPVTFEITKKITSQLFDKLGFDEAGRSLNKRADQDLELQESLQKVNLKVADPRKFKERITDPVWLARGLGENTPNLLASIGVAAPLAVAGAPAIIVGGAAFGSSALMEGGSAYNEAIEFGADEQTAENVAVLSALGIGLLDSLPITRVLTRSPIGQQIEKRFALEFARRVMMQMGEEGGTESLQEIFGNTVAKMYDENRDVLQGVPESAFFGSIMGGGTEVGAGVTRETLDSANKLYQSMTPAQRQGGYLNLFGKEEAPDPEEIKLAYVDQGKTSAEQESLDYRDRIYYHGMSKKRLEEFEKTGEIPSAEQEFGGEFSITDDYEYAKAHSYDGKVVALRMSPDSDIKSADPFSENIDELDDPGHFTDIGDGEYLVFDPSKLRVEKSQSATLAQVAQGASIPEIKTSELKASTNVQKRVREAINPAERPVQTKETQVLRSKMKFAEKQTRWVAKSAKKLGEKIGKFKTEMKLIPDAEAMVRDFKKNFRSRELSQRAAQLFVDGNLPVTARGAFIKRIVDARTPAKLRDVLTEASAIATKIKESDESRREVKRMNKIIGYFRKEKNLNAHTVNRLKQIHGVGFVQKIVVDPATGKNKRRSVVDQNTETKEKLQKVIDDLKKLQPGDKFLTDNPRGEGASQVKGLKHYLETGFPGRDPRTVTQRELQEKFKEDRNIMDGSLTKFLSNYAFPTVDIKQGHPVIERVVNMTDTEMRAANIRTRKYNEELDSLMDAAEKGSKLKKSEVGERIFRAMSGETIADITTEEAAVVDYLKEYFAKAKETLGLTRYRKNYITNIEKTVFEKMMATGSLFEAVKAGSEAVWQKMKDPDKSNIPLDVMLALDNIIGSEKFFRFALQRKGGMDPSTDIRRIFLQYSHLAETKVALDKILPEGQAAQQLLLQDKSAIWLRSFLQNQKGRALDFKFRNGKMGWVGKAGDRIVDFMYVSFLGLRYLNSLKNLVGGEVNSFAESGVVNYLKGKKRLITNPKKAYKMIMDMGVLEGNYVDIAYQSFTSKAGRYAKHVLYWQQEAVEYEIRGSFMLGELTDAEWESGTMTQDRFRQVLDKLGYTQGLYTKVDSPLFVQTLPGRMTMQFARWQLTNTMLLRRYIKGAKVEVAAKNYKGENMQKIIRLMSASGVMLYVSLQLAQAGYEEAEKVAKSGAEMILTTVNLLTLKNINQALRENPAIETFGALSFSAQQLAHLVLPDFIAESPDQIEFSSGLEGLFVVKRVSDLTSEGEEGGDGEEVEVVDVEEEDIEEVEVEE